MAILAVEYVPRTFKVSDAFTVIFSRRKCHVYLIRLKVVAKNVRRIFNCVCVVYTVLYIDFAVKSKPFFQDLLQSQLFLLYSLKSTI